MPKKKNYKKFNFDSISPIDTSPGSSTVGDATPTTGFSMVDDTEDYQHPPSPVPRETAPWPGETYIIQDPKTKRQITLVEGKLRLEDHLGFQGGYHWRCIETDGWLGFRNPIDNSLIGHDNEKNFIAQNKSHKSWEFFNTRAHPDGGYILLVVHGWVQWKMTIAKDGRSLVETRDGGTAWEFVKV
ncbi:hypothetical protein F4819DRAFT_18962 [Hypoxylon fuscum]|nr:hypothetical protein F4819DRAFT_18962 [Hypoxylon fuscum]